MPFCFSMAATVAIAVPQMPMKWIGYLNRALLDEDSRAIVRDDAAGDAQRQRQRRPVRVTRGKPDHDRTGKIPEEVGHDGARGRLSRRLVAPRQLADHD